MAIVIALMAIAVPLGLAIWATVVVARDRLSEQRQKVAQWLLVWLVPFVGPIIVLAVHRPDEAPSRRYPETREEGEDFEGGGRGAKAVREALDDD